MAKKLSLLIAAVAVLAFAIPSVASAAEATVPAGTRAPVGTEVTGTGKEVILNSDQLGVIKCEKLTLNGTITTNNGTTIKASGNNTSPASTNCFNGKKVVTVESVNLEELFANGSGTGTKSGTVTFTAKLDIAGQKCTFKGTKVPGTYVSGTNVLKASNSGSIPGSPELCGTATLSGEFALEKKGSTTPVILD